MARNPAWTDEEIVLATELYVRSEERVLGPSHPDVIALSQLLNEFHFHSRDERQETFRNPKGVGMKLANIRGADPTREGGFMHGSKRDGLYWDELDGDEQKLFHLAAEVRRRNRLVQHQQDESKRAERDCRT